jgi:hypothetical protein
MADQPRVQLRCDGCGQTDDHPKMHYGAQTYHHDCIPAFVMDDLTSETYYEVQGNQLVMSSRVPLPEERMQPGTRRLLQIRDKAQSGTRGPKLLNWIDAQPPSEEVFGTSENEEN